MITPTQTLKNDEWNAFIEADHAATTALSSRQRNKLANERRYTHFVYRYRSNKFPEGKQLLYVGFTSDFGSRDAIHWVNSWWRGLVTSYDMDVYPRSTRAEVRAAEARTIRDEVPLFNIHKNPRHAEVHGPYWTGASVEQRVNAAIADYWRSNGLSA